MSFKLKVEFKNDGASPVSSRMMTKEYPCYYENRSIGVVKPMSVGAGKWSGVVKVADTMALKRLREGFALGPHGARYSNGSITLFRK